jgi:hypothetical protein
MLRRGRSETQTILVVVNAVLGTAADGKTAKADEHRATRCAEGAIAFDGERRSATEIDVI